MQKQSPFGKANAMVEKRPTSSPERMSHRRNTTERSAKMKR